MQDTVRTGEPNQNAEHLEIPGTKKTDSSFLSSSFNLSIVAPSQRRHVDSSASLLDPVFNKESAFTLDERRMLNIEGLLPPVVESLDQQVDRAYKHLLSFHSGISKHVYLSSLRSRNVTLFYKLIKEHLVECLPLIYTPVVGEACIKFGQEFRQSEGLYLSLQQRGRVSQCLENYSNNDVGVIVISDGSRILGLGDLGAGGVGIPIGKLRLYVAAGGIHPATCLPIILDTGCNTPDIRDHPHYMGLRRERAKDDEFYPFVHEVVTEIKRKWPTALLQWEDFSNDHCFTLLEKYREKILSFNDDIQGTGAVVAAGIVNAVKLSGVEAKDHRFLVYGCGSAAVGVVNQIIDCFVALFGLKKQDARELFFLVDSKGLLGNDRGTTIADYKKPFVCKSKATISLLTDCIADVRPTVLIGLAGQGPHFTTDIIKTMADMCERPIIFALSNPTSKAECSFSDAMQFSNEKVIYASGSPFPPFTLSNGKLKEAGQGNNLYVFPGIGLGATICEAKYIPDEVITAAAIALAAMGNLDEEELYPCLNRVQECSIVIAAAVITKTKEMGLVQNTHFKDLEGNKLRSFIKAHMYDPHYHQYNKETKSWNW